LVILNELSVKEGIAFVEDIVVRLKVEYVLFLFWVVVFYLFFDDEAHVAEGEAQELL